MIQVHLQVYRHIYYDRLLKLLEKDSTHECSANIEGIVHDCSVHGNAHEWIVDTRATNHMFSDLSLVENQIALPNNLPRIVHLPNGNMTEVSHIDTYEIALDGVIKMFSVLQISTAICY